MRGMRLAIGLVTAATLVALFVVARPDGEDASGEATTAAVTRTEPPELEPIEPTATAETETAEPEPVRLMVAVRGGRPLDGIARADAKQGDSIVLVVRSDVADHVHVHGYDLMADVGPGRPARMQFRATLTGRFEIELEDVHRQIAQLTVLP
jgi:hypothetical protein